MQYRNSGFTLIEVSIVLVIIGLIVGGILAGQDLINTAAIRAQISQIEKYNTAVHAFQNKYGGLPGDLSNTLANQFGFVTTSCNASLGQRDGNGIIDGYWSGGPVYTTEQGEAVLFWSDLNMAGLIGDVSPNNSAGIFTVQCGAPSTALSLTAGTYYIGNFLPVAKIGNGNFVYVYDSNTVDNGIDNNNWFGISAVTSVPTNGSMLTNPGMSVTQAYRIDQKTDDGFPLKGNVRTGYLTGEWVQHSPDAASDSTTTCYNWTTNTYSISINQGTGINCALSMRLQ
ncbi:MAG TPA: prepilin-type N-terminal cleavage/methylation domain-containing protein [Rickettsiales bacterium]|nr:prepilin-type N-terminal cleavage/methylation domain-containing protein [Rickettsiales bacterium]